MRLEKAAIAMGGTSQRQWEDLLQEALTRVWTGGRSWPTHVELVPFLRGVMRSIADEWRSKPRVMLTVVAQASRAMEGGHVGTASAVVTDRTGTVLPDLVPREATPEAVMNEAEERKLLRNKLTELFADDEDAQMILEGILEGLQGESLRELTKLDKTAFESKQKKIRRRIENVRAARSRR
jgi:DNA-directed RNA polymerase specialized sigma24 family protein